MKMFKKTIVIAMTLPLVFGSMSVFAGQDHHHRGNKIFSQLDLTATQKEEMKTLRQNYRSENKAQRVEHRKLMQAERQQLEKLVLADNFDEAAVRTLAEKMARQQAERRVERLANRHQVLSILTPEQKAKYIELKQLKAKKHTMGSSEKKHH